MTIDKTMRFIEITTDTATVSLSRTGATAVHLDRHAKAVSVFYRNNTYIPIYAGEIEDLIRIYNTLRDELLGY